MRVERSIEVNVPSEHFFDLVVDFASYPAFLKDCIATQIHGQDADTWDVEFTVRVIRNLDYRLKLVGERPGKVSWSLISGRQFERNDGAWTIEAIGPESTRVTYCLDVAIYTFVPKAIMDRLIQFTLPSMLKQWAAQAEERYRREPEAPE